METTCVYEVNLARDELVPVESAWGSPPKYEFLHPDKVLVIDFGSEVYVYNGKNAAFETRKVGARLAGELWSSGWNYSQCLMNPVYGSRREMVREETRPEWTVLGRINSCMETILFREKFLDWPDKTRVIGTRVGGDKERDDIIDVNVSPQWAWADLQVKKLNFFIINIFFSRALMVMRYLEERSMILTWSWREVILVEVVDTMMKRSGDSMRSPH